MKTRRITISETDYMWLKDHQDNLKEITEIHGEIVAMFLEGKSQEEIEQTLDVSIDTINKTYNERLESYALAMYCTLKLK